MIKLIIAAGGYILSSFVLRFFAALGISFFTYKALDVVVTASLDKIQSTISGAPADLLNILALTGFPAAMSIIAGALLTSVAITSLKTFLGKSK